MRHTDNHPYRRRTGFISLLLALIGIGTSSCIGPTMYGTPHAEFEIKGKVVSEDGKAVESIQVVLPEKQISGNGVIYDQEFIPIDTLYSNSIGEFQMERSIFPARNLQIDFHDIDGEKNLGEFEDVTLVYKDIEYEGGKGWYSGKAEITVPEVILKKKHD